MNKQPQEALEWFISAAEKGNADAQNALGILYEWGYGVEKDPQKAAYWYDQADSRNFASSWIAYRKVNYFAAKGKGKENLSLSDVLDLVRK